MADNFKNTRIRKSVKTDLNDLRNKLPRKRQRFRRKNKQYFKRKNHLRSVAFRKRKSKMNNFTATIPSLSNGGQHVDEQCEVSYWKARAISLEFENNMLHKHIKQMYMNMIPYNQQMLDSDGQYFERTNDEEYFSCEDKETVKKSSKIKVKKELEDEEDSKPPSEQISKKREEEMERLYGSSWRTIIGMETAVQLNYDVTVERNNSQYWPIVSIKNA